MKKKISHKQSPKPRLRHSLHYILGVAVLILILAIVILIICIKKEKQVCFDKNCFIVEMANTPAERELGLMYRTTVDENRGMLFIFPQEDIYPFWMKNTKIPLDMLWLDSSYRVVYIEKNATPCILENCPIITPTKSAKYVLEINAGLVDKYSIKLESIAKIK
jgi:uncharacterized membrane protein (UPF0127 family)